MSVTLHEGGAFTVEGKEGMKLYRMLSLKSALKLETKGIKIRRGFSALKTIKQEFNFTGSKEKVLEAFTKLCEEQSAKVPRVDERKEAIFDAEVPAEEV